MFSKEKAQTESFIKISSFEPEMLDNKIVRDMGLIRRTKLLPPN